MVADKDRYCYARSIAQARIVHKIPHSGESMQRPSGGTDS